MKHFPYGLTGFLCGVAALGVAGDLLLRAGPLGINVTLFLAAALGVPAFEARRHSLLREPSARVTLGAAIVFSLLYSWRDTSPVSLLVLAVIGVSIVLTAAVRLGRDPRLAYLWDYALDAVRFGVYSVRLPFSLVLQTQRADRPAKHTVSATGFAVLRGVLIAAPLIVLFGALLISADAIFESIVTDLFDIDFETVFSHILIFAICGWFVGTIWWQCLEGAVGNPIYGDGGLKSFRFGAIEINVALGLVTALFLSFIAVQARYFFGGHERVLTEAGLTYADYARQGFFELATVAGIALAVLIGCSQLLEGASPGGRRAYRTVAGIFVAAVLVIVASAFHRMNLYIDAYGLTRLRLYTASFMVWTAVVFLWLYFCIHRDRLRHFAWGFLLSGYAATFALVAANPDAVIARVNMQRAIDGQSIDLEYMDLLSLESIPPMVRALPRLEDPDQERVRAFLNIRAGESAERPARTWTLGVTRAAYAFESQED